MPTKTYVIGATRRPATVSYNGTALTEYGDVQSAISAGRGWVDDVADNSRLIVTLDGTDTPWNGTLTASHAFRFSTAPKIFAGTTRQAIRYLTGWALYTPAPDTPTNVAAVAKTATAGTITVSWDAVSGATGYYVYAATSSGGALSLIATVTSGTSYDHSGLGTNTTRYYKVSAYNGTGESAKSSEVSATTLVGATTVASYVTRVSNSSLTITWSAVTGATSYKVYRSTSSGSGFSLVETVASTTHTSTGLSTGTAYYYHVVAASSAGDGPQSNEISAHTPSVFDNFDRANNASVLGTATTGQGWSNLTRNMGITSNKAYPNAGANLYCNAYISSGLTSFILGFTISDSTGSMGSNAYVSNYRYTNANNRNYFYLSRNTTVTGTTKFANVKVIAGVFTTIASNTTETFDTGDRWEVDCRTAGHVKFLRNGTELYDHTDSSNTSATSHDIGGYNDSNIAIRFDNFFVAQT